jgi:hypothetical protein
MGGKREWTGLDIFIEWAENEVAEFNIFWQNGRYMAKNGCWYIEQKPRTIKQAICKQ